MTRLTSLRQRAVPRYAPRSIFAIFILVALFVIVGPVRPQGYLNYGDTVSGDVSAAVPSRLYHFTGRAGDSVSIIARADGPVRLTLLSPLLGQIALSSASAQAEISQTLPQTGVYHLVVARVGAASGEFTLMLESAGPVSVALLQPEDGAALPFTGSLTFAWEPVPGAAVYLLQREACDAAYTNCTPMVPVTTDLTSVTIEHGDTRPARWRVRPTFVDGSQGEFSAWRTFSFDLPTATTTPKPAGFPTLPPQVAITLAPTSTLTPTATPVQAGSIQVTASPVAVPLEAPRWLEPAQETTIIDRGDVTITFRWQAVAGAEAYRIRVVGCTVICFARDRTIRDGTEYGLVVGSAGEFEWNPAPGDNYTVSVRALRGESSAGWQESGASSEQRYVVYQPAPAATPTRDPSIAIQTPIPGRATSTPSVFPTLPPQQAIIITTPTPLPQPPDGAVLPITDTITYAWEPVPGAVRYQVWQVHCVPELLAQSQRADCYEYADVALGSGSVFQTEETTITVSRTSLEPHVWRVNPINAAGAGFSTGSWYTFSFDRIQPPTLVQPANGAMLSPMLSPGVISGNTQNVTFAWEPVPGATEYSILWETRSSPAAPWQFYLGSFPTTLTTITLQHPQQETRWRVAARDANGYYGPYSEWFTFGFHPFGTRTATPTSSPLPIATLVDQLQFPATNTPTPATFPTLPPQVAITLAPTVTPTPLPAISGPPLLTATPLPAPSVLTGTHWRLTALNAALMALPDTLLRLEFVEPGRVTGNGGCNGFGASYSVSEQLISFGPISAGRVFCDGAGVMDQEALFFAALEAATSFVYDGGQLIIVYGPNQFLFFVPFTPPADTAAPTPTMTPTAVYDPISDLPEGDMPFELGLRAASISFELAWPPDPVNYASIRAYVGDPALLAPNITYELRLECALEAGDNVQWTVFGAPGVFPLTCADVVPLTFNPNRAYWDMQVMLDHVAQPVRKAFRLVAAPVDAVAPAVPTLVLPLSFTGPVSVSGALSFPQGMRDTDVTLLLPTRDPLSAPVLFEVTVTCAGRVEPLHWNILNVINPHQPPGFDTGPHLCGMTVPFAYSSPEVQPSIAVWYDWPPMQSFVSFTVTVRPLRPPAAASATPTGTASPVSPQPTSTPTLTPQPSISTPTAEPSPVAPRPSDTPVPPRPTSTPTVTPSPIPPRPTATPTAISARPTLTPTPVPARPTTTPIPRQPLEDTPPPTADA